MQHAARELGLLRLVVFGRGAKEAGPKLEESLRGAPVELRVHAVLPPEEAAQRLAEADVQLNVRGEISTRRGSVIAGICTGLPVVGYRGAHTDFPITEAGVRFAPIGDEGALARELVNVLGDPRLAEELRQRSRDAARAHFSWEAIAGRYVAALGLPSGMPEEAVHSGGRPG
jgi:glycosyltransferase involved in cell wall biosynthesis